MIDIVEGIKKLIDSDSQFVTATVIKTWGSGPRKVGSGMVISTDNTLLGSVSGGCVEGDVVKQARLVLEDNRRRIVHYGISDDEAWDAGLSCGGQIEILLEKTDASTSPTWKKLIELVESNTGCILTSSIEGPTEHYITQADNPKSSSIANSALEAYAKRKSGVYEIKRKQYFHNVFPKKSQLIIIGAAHISSSLVKLASMFDFEVIVADPRGLFSDNTNFEVQPDQLHKMWPAELFENMTLDADVYAVLLTHDPKIDDQALEILLKSKVSYIGALGSRKTHDKRKTRLAELGFSEIELDRIHAPIGLNINASNPKEIALSIVGELIQVRNQYLR